MTGTKKQKLERPELYENQTEMNAWKTRLNKIKTEPYEGNQEQREVLTKNTLTRNELIGTAEKSLGQGPNYNEHEKTSER